MHSKIGTYISNIPFQFCLFVPLNMPLSLAEARCSEACRLGDANKYNLFSFLLLKAATASKPAKMTRRTEVMDSKFGSWEKHTTGFGSKMLQKMGWKHGQGLGSSGEGIVNPVKATRHTEFGRGLVNIHSQVRSHSHTRIFRMRFQLLYTCVPIGSCEHHVAAISESHLPVRRQCARSRCVSR